MARPVVIEPGMKHYMDYALESSNLFKRRVYNYIFNGSLFTIFVIFTVSFLYYNWKNKLSPEEREKENIKKTQQIIEKVKSLNHKFSTPNENVFEESKINEKYGHYDVNDAFLNDPHRITNLPPLKFM